MELNLKIQELRKQKGLTQEELAAILYVSRTAVSKWESGRGYPSIDSLKAISEYFAISIDDLLSGDELLSACQEDNKRKELHLRNKVFGILDIGSFLLFVLPIFGQKAEYGVNAVTLMQFVSYGQHVRNIYLAGVLCLMLIGVLILLLQNSSSVLWQKTRYKLSVAVNTIMVLVFIGSLQPYAALFLFLTLSSKVMMLIKWH